MNAKDFITLLDAKAREKGIELFQISFHEEKNFEIQVLEQEVVKQVSEQAQALDFSVVVNGRRGKAASNGRFTAEDADFLIAEALENSTAQEIDEAFFLFPGGASYHAVKPFCSDMVQFEKLDVAAYLREAERLAYAYDTRIERVLAAYAYRIEQKAVLRNSLGLDLCHEKHLAAAALNLRVKDGSRYKNAGDMVFFDKDEDFSAETLVRKAASRVLPKIGARDVLPGRVNVVFENRVFCDVLQVISEIFGAYEAEQGYCQFKGKIGQKVASPLVTLSDEPWLEGGMESRAYDAEGVPTCPKFLIKDGVLSNMLYNLSMAEKHGVKSSGNAAGGLATRVFNLKFAPGKISREQLLRQAGQGVFVTSLAGVNVGVSLVSGDFSFGAEGFAIEDGKLGAALNQFTLSGNIYALLEGISAVADDVFCYKKAVAPSVLASGVCTAA